MSSLLFLCFVLAWVSRKISNHFAAKSEKEFFSFTEMSVVEIIDEIKALPKKGDRNTKIAFIADMMNVFWWCPKKYAACFFSNLN